MLHQQPIFAFVICFCNSLTIHSHSKDNFAKLFVVKGSLAGKSFELAMDDLHFISFPCLISGQTDEPPASGESSEEKAPDVISMFNIVIATISGQAMQRINKNFLYKCQCKYLSHCGEDPIAAALGLRLYSYGICKQSLRRVLEAATNALCTLEKKQRYVSREVATMVRLMDRKHDPLPAEDVSAGAPTIVSVVQFPRSKRSGSSSSTGSSEGHTSIPMQHTDSGTLIPSLAEQQQSSMHSLMLQSRHTSSERCNTVTDQAWPGELQALFMQQSILANELRLLFHNLSGGHSANLQFNGTKAINVALACKDRKTCLESRAKQPCLCAADSLFGLTAGPVQLPLPAADTVASKTNDKTKGISPSMQTMLALAEPDCIVQILSMLDGRSMASQHADPGRGPAALKQSRLYTFLEASDPTKSFLDLSMMLDEPVDELTSMATYLQGWGLAEIIPVIYTHSCYKVHMHAPLHAHTRVNNAFDRLMLTFSVLGSSTKDFKVSSSGRFRPPPAQMKRNLYSDLATTPRQTITSRSSGQLASNSALGSASKGGKGIGAEVSGVAMVNLSPTPSKLGFPFRRNSSDEGTRRNSIDFDNSPPPPPMSMPFPMPSDFNASSKHRPPGPGPIIPPMMATTPPSGTSLVNTPVEDWKLVRVLELFDGMRPLGEVLQMLPSSLKDFGLDIVIFLLRWHMIVQVDAYLVNLLAMPLPARELSLLNLLPSSNASSSTSSPRPPTSSRMSSEESKNLGLDLLPMDSPTANFWQPGNTAAKGEVPLSLLVNPWVDLLSPAERQVLEKIAPFLQASGPGQTSLRCSAAQNAPLTTSLKALGEVLYLTRLKESDVMQLLSKLPYLKILRKITHPYA